MLRRSAFYHLTGALSTGVLLMVAMPLKPVLAIEVSSSPSLGTQVTGDDAALLQEFENQEVRADRIISSQIEIARERAHLSLELDDGRTIEFGLHDGKAWAGDRALGSAPRGGALDRAWRTLLNEAMDTPTDELAALLAGWAPPVSATEARVALHSEMVRGLIAGQGSSTPVIPDPSQLSEEGGTDYPVDTVAKLQQRIAELEERIEEGTSSLTTQSGQRSSRTTTVNVNRRSNSWYSPLRHIGQGIAAVLGDIVLLAVLIGIGFAVVYFARKPLEAIADTARNETLRSGLVGLAASFLVLPGYVLGILALVISIVGIPLLLVWLPLFWVALGVAVLVGYLAIGHGIGEGLAERRFHGGDWAKRANSYYYVMTGLIVLFVPFIAGHIVQMAGPWLSFIKGMLIFLGSAVTWLAFTIGLGAVLLTRAGTRPRARTPSTPADIDMSDLFEEESHV